MQSTTHIPINPERRRWLQSLQALALSLSCAWGVAAAQELESVPLPQPSSCFGLSSVVEPQALAICAALNGELTVRARELAERWLQEAPDTAAAHYALAEVLLGVEGNVTRALFHLNQAEALSPIRSLDAMLAAVEAQASGEAAATPLWHYLTLNQLSSVHQLIGNQEESLRYLAMLSDDYGLDLEAYRGWPLIKLGRFEEAGISARRVLNGEDVDPFAAAQAWNTLCAVELANPSERLKAPACDRALALDEAALAAGEELSTVTLTNAAEVALSRLQIATAESLVDRATRRPNPNSVSNPWIQKVYLSLAQGRFEQAQRALEQMLVWRDRQEPLITVSNRAEHYLAGATLLLLAGYTEDSARLAGSALDQPDRNGNFSADDSQKDAIAALITTLALRADYQSQLEIAAAAEGTQRLSLRARAQGTRLAAWRAERRAASLFADEAVMINRLRPYAPLDVHIPEWMEPEIASLLGAGAFESLLQAAHRSDAFVGASGYGHAFQTEVASLREEDDELIRSGELALEQLPHAEVALRARVQWHIAQAQYRSGRINSALDHFAASLRQDPSLARRLGQSIPVTLTTDGSPQAQSIRDKLIASPRFRGADLGLRLESGADSVCLLDQEGIALSCYTAQPIADGDADSLETRVAREFQRQLFSVGIELSKAQRSVLRGASVVLRSQSTRDASPVPNF